MSFYYKYNFIPPDQIFAEIKEEMDSYFTAGIVDDVMFFTYLNGALRKLGNGAKEISETAFELKDFTASLPSDFHLAREVWLCTDVVKVHQAANAYYDARTCMLAPSEYDPCNPCDNCLEGCVEKKTLVFKTTGQVAMTFSIHTLLSPGNISVRDKCSKDCANYNASSPWTFDIRDGKLVTNLSHGVIYLIYYKNETTEDGYSMVPNSEPLLDFIRSFIKYKMYEKIWNSVTDETANQLYQKYIIYQAEMFEKKVIAETEMKKRTIQQTFNSIKDDRRRLNKFRIR